MERRVRGQPRAVRVLCALAGELLGGQRQGNESCLVFLLGAPGLGKTFAVGELARAMNAPLLRLDMSVMPDTQTFQRLLADQHRSCPGLSVTLLDEFEKASLETVHALLPVDSGFLPLPCGGSLDLTRTLICLTSNFGSDRMVRARTPLDQQLARQDLQQQFDARFSPEFMDRIREIVAFDALDQAARRQIAADLLELEIVHQSRRLRRPIGVQPETVSLIARLGFRSGVGARPMQSVVRTQIRKALREVPPGRSGLVLGVRGQEVVIL